MKFVRFIAIICAILVAVPVKAFTVDGFNFEVTGASTAMLVSRWPPYHGAITVPRRVEYEGVTYTVNSVGASAFRGAEFLTSIKLLNSITSIGANAFEDCSQLKRIEIPEGVKSMGSRVFAGCTALQNVIFKGNSLTAIPNGAFYECRNLKSLLLPDKVKTIESLAFARSGIEVISMGASLDEIEPFAFDDCTSLKRVEIKSLENWCEIDFHSIYDNPLYRAHTLVLNGDTVKTINIPDGVEHVKAYCFAGCNASGLDIPKSVKYLDLSAFLACSYLRNVYIPNSVTDFITSNLDDNTDRPFPNTEYLYLGTGVHYIPPSTFYFSYRLRDLILMEGLEEIGHEAFKYSKISHLVFPITLRAMQASFSECTSLESVTLNAALQRMSNGVFSQCRNLKAIYSLVTDPATIEFDGTGQFDGVNLNTCVLYVPENSIQLYKNNPNWKDFKNIVALKPITDVDRSGITDVEDANMIINTFLSIGKPGCNYVAADVNHDGLVDVEDINRIINTILGLQ